MKLEDIGDIILFKPYIPEPEDAKIIVNIGDELNHKRFGNGFVEKVYNYEYCLVNFGTFKKKLIIKFAGF